ncbi:MAG: Ig-like domain-containing protein [Acidobacteriota bacterium]
MTRSDGAGTAEPRPEMTTGADGRFLIAVAPGTHELTVARAGYSPVFRVATAAAGEGTEVFTPRLEPIAAAEVLDPAGDILQATTASGRRATLTLPAGALAAPATAALSILSEQALPALLPYGWSPRGAAWIDLEETALLQPATLELPVAAPAGSVLTLAQLDLETLQWRAVAEQAAVSSAAGPTVTFTLTTAFPGAGAWAALEADGGDLSPPAPVVGEILGSAATPTVADVQAAVLGFSPEIVLPTQTADVEATYTFVTEQPSGLPLTLVIQEELELVDGSVRREAPYRAQLVLYRDAAGTPSSRFRLRPSAVARSQPVRLGAEDVTVLRYADEGVRGNVLGPAGGSVLGASGDRLEVPAGALSEPTPVILGRGSVADLPLGAPSGGTAAAVLDLDLGGAELAAAAGLEIALDPAPSPSARGLLLQVVDLVGGPAYRAVAELEPTAAGYATVAIDVADLPWPGIRSGGFYVALTLDFEPAFAVGTALGGDGLAAAGAVISSPQVDWVQFSGADGRYVLPVPTGEVQIDLLDTATGNTASVTVTASAADERVDAPIQATPTGPRVLSTTPGDGAEAPAGIQPQISFSEAVDPSSVPAGVELLRDGRAVPVAFDVQGALVTVLPGAGLAPGATYELRITGGLGDGVRDLRGYGLESPVTVRFTVSEVALPTGLDLDKVTLFAPVGGLAQIVGDPGAVPANTLVWVENLTSFQTTESVTSSANGAFSLQIGAEVTDEILFHVLVDGGNEVVKLLGPFMSADRRGAFIGRDAATFRTVDGVTVIAEEGTFDAHTEVRVAPRGLADPAAPWPASGVLEPVYSFDLDFGGAEARRPLNLRVPAPADAQPEWYLLAKTWDFFGQELWSMKDILVLDGGELTTERTAAAPGGSSVTSPGGAALESAEKSAAGRGLEARRLGASEPSPAAGSPRAGEKSASTDPRDYKVALWSAGNFGVFRSGGAPLQWAVVTVDALGVVFNDTTPGMVVEALDALDAVSGAQDWAVPTLLGQDFELYARDSRTGFELFREVITPTAGPLQVLPPSQLLDRSRPFPLGGQPLLVQVVAASPGERQLAPGITATVTDQRDADGVLLPNQTLTVTFGERSLVIDRRPGSDAPIPLEAKLTSMADGGETAIEITEAIEAGDVTLSRSVALGESALLTVGAVLRLDQWLEMDWSEALDEGLDGFQLELVEGSVDIPTAVEPVGTYERIRIRPEAGWRAGTAYRLKLNGSIADVAGNELLPVDQGSGCAPSCPRQDIAVRFEVRAQRVFQGFNFTAVRDVERLGSLLFVAAGQQGLWVLDASDPENLVNYFGAGSGLHFAFPLGDAVGGVALDPHGRVLVSGGGVSGPGQVKILDPLAFPENPTTNADLVTAWRGSTLVSNRLGGSQFASMPPTTPNHLEILSRDRGDSWTLGVDGAPDGLSVTPGEIPGLGDMVLTVAGSDGVDGQPVSLRNLTRGTWERADAGVDGSYSLSLDARRGDRIQILRNTDALVYVQLDGHGLAAVDYNHFYGESDDADGDGVPDDPEIVQSQVLRYYTHSILENEPDDPLCDPNGLYLGDDPIFLASDFALLGRGTDGPWFLPTLVQSYGLVMIAVDGNNPVEVNKVDWRCAVGRVPNPTSGDIGRMTGMGVVERFPADVIYDDDAILRAPEEAREVEIAGETVPVGRDLRDYAFIGNSHGHVYAVDVTNRLDLRIVARIELPTAPAGPMTVDVEGRRLLVSGGTDGVYVVDLGGPFPLAAIDLDDTSPIDIDGDARDDRVLEQLEVRDPISGEPLNVNRRVELWNDLGLAWIGGIQNLSNPGELGLGGLVVREPRVRFLGTSANGLLEVDQLAPFGAPTAAVPGAPEGTEYPGLFRVEMHLPGELADAAGELKVDLVAVAPGGGEIAGAGDPDRLAFLPPTGLKGDDGLVLKRQSDVPWHEGYQLYLSEPILSIADLRASHFYVMTEAEKSAKDISGDDLCRRCDLQAPELGVYPAAGVPPAEAYRELLSGHRIAIRLQDSTEAALVGLYGRLLASEAEAEVASVPWDLGPSSEQEPFHGASKGHGDVAPGTLLHSGEFTHGAADLEMPGLGFDFLFTRSYRNQTVGGGPLGPGWDFGYRARLRPLPNGDVDFFDGTGRRATFHWDPDEKRLDPPPGVFVRLTRDATGYRLKDRAGSLLHFDRYGRLLSMLDRFRVDDSSGSVLRFEYDAASNLRQVSGAGRFFSFEYDADGRLGRLVDDTGRDVLFNYDLDGRLEEVQSPPTALSTGASPGRLVTQYAYESADSPSLRAALNRRDNVTRLVDARSVAWLELTWAPGDGGMGHRLATQTWGDDVLSLAIQDAGQTTVTDRRGEAHRYVHNESGQALSYEDPGGHTTRWTYGAYGDNPEQGLLTEVTLPSGRKVAYSYVHAENHGNGGRVAQILMPNLSKMELLPGPGDAPQVGGACGPDDPSTNGSADAIATTYAGHHPWTFIPKVVTGPDASVSTKTWKFDDKRHGWPSAIDVTVPTGYGADAAAQTVSTALIWDDFGRTTLHTRPGTSNVTVATDVAFTAESRVPEAQTVSSGGEEFRVDYEKDAVGRIVEAREPGDVTHTTAYNAVGWPLEQCTLADGLNRCTRYTYLPNGLVAKVETPFGEDGQQHTAAFATYGTLGEPLVTEQEVLPGGARHTQTRTYDEGLNLLSIDGTGRTATVQAYDARGLPQSRTTFDDDGSALVEAFLYNGDGQVTSYTDPRGKIWRTLYDGYGRVMQSLDPESNASGVTYDGAGRPRSATGCDASGQALMQRETYFDSAGRLVAQIAVDPDGEVANAVTRSHYDEASNLVRTVDPVGRTTDYTYDGFQRLLELSVNGGAVYRQTWSDFDVRGRALRETTFLPAAGGSPSSYETTFEYDGLDRRTAVIDGLLNRHELAYDVRGNVLRETAPGSFVTAYAYDGLDRLTQATRPSGIAVSYDYVDGVDAAASARVLQTARC